MYFSVRPLVVSLVIGLATLVGCSSSNSYVPVANFAPAGTPLVTVPMLSVQPLSIPPVHRVISASAAPRVTSNVVPPRAVASAATRAPYQAPYVAGAMPLKSGQRAITSGQQFARTVNRDLRVMTFNLRVSTIIDGQNTWGFRKGQVIERIRDFDPDLLGTQEGLNAQEKYLQEELPDYTFFGAGRSDGKRGGEMCGVFFKSSKFEKLAGGHFWLSMTPEKPGSKGWGAPFPRMVTWVKLRPRNGGQSFCWFNTHFEAFSARAREESAKLLQQRIVSIAGGMPTIVTGDFNAGDGSRPHSTLCSTAGPGPQLIDAFRAANRFAQGRDEGTRHGFSGNKSGERIDWILMSPAFQCLSAEIDRTRGLLGYPSDHFPVTATLRMIPGMLNNGPVAAAE